VVFAPSTAPRDSTRPPSTSVRSATPTVPAVRTMPRIALPVSQDSLSTESVSRTVLLTSSPRTENAKPAMLNAVVVLRNAPTASTVPLDTTNAVPSVSRPAIPTSMLISPLLPASLVTLSAKLAQVNSSAQPVPILKQSPSMEFVTIAHILAILAALPPPSAPAASLVSILLDRPASLPAPLEPVPSTGSVNAVLDSSTLTNVLLPALPASALLEDSAPSVLTTVFHVQDLPVHASAASTAMPLTLSLECARSPLTASSDNISLNHPTDVPVFAPPALSTTNLSV